MKDNRVFSVVLIGLLFNGCASLSEWNNQLIANQNRMYAVQDAYKNQSNMVGWSRATLLNNLGQPYSQSKSYAGTDEMEFFTYKTWNSSGGNSTFSVTLTNGIVTGVFY